MCSDFLIHHWILSVIEGINISVKILNRARAHTHTNCFP